MSAAIAYDAVSIIHDIVMAISLLTYSSQEKKNNKISHMLHSSTTKSPQRFKEHVLVALIVRKTGVTRPTYRECKSIQSTVVSENID